MQKGLLIITLLIVAGILVYLGYRAIDPLNQFSDSISETVLTKQQETENRADAIVKCRELCQEKANTGRVDFERGECLSNEIMPGWVCDIAHQPRLDVDNESRNQCPAYRDGKVSNYVEVDGNCDLITICTNCK